MSTQVFGPFTVGVRGGRGNTRVRTGITVQPKDLITTYSTGLVDFGGAVLGIGAPILDADGDDWTTPSNYPAPDQRKNSLLVQVDSKYFQGGKNKTLTIPSDVSGELFLDVNDATPKDNSRGWSVYIYHTPFVASGGVQPPHVMNWSFATIAGEGGIFGADVGICPKALDFDYRKIDVFYEGAARLNHIRIDPDLALPLRFQEELEEILDGNSTADGRTTNSIGEMADGSYADISAVKFINQMHVFYVDAVLGRLRHASGNGVTWQFEDLDGHGGSNGRIQGICGFFNCALMYNTGIHVFYFGSTDLALGQGPGGHGEGTGNLRHAIFDGNNWTFEIIDGHAEGPNGEINAMVGTSPSATVDSNGDLHVFYYDQDHTNLRHALLRPGQSPRFETLDGSGDPNPSDVPSGQTKAHVGVWSVCASFRDTLHVFYYDMSYGNIRHAALPNGGAWTFEKFDGGGGPGGRVKSNVGHGPMSLAVLPDQLSLFYYDQTKGNLRHAWTFDGRTWLFENLDGDGGPAGRITQNVGQSVGSVVHNGILHVFYDDHDNKDLRYALYA